jgi:long-chain acyl-CoA synthetase
VTQLDHLGYVIGEAVRLVPDRPALLQDDVVVTYDELDQRADRVAGWLISNGVRPRSRVALLWDNDFRYVEQFLGVMRAGAVAVPMNIRQSDEILAYVLDDADAVGVLASPRLVGRGAALVKAAGVTTAEPFLAGPDEPQQAERLQHRIAHDPDDVCMQPYTSGSTGRPKGVPLTHRGQIWNVDTYSRCYLLDETDRALLAAPMYHKNAAMEMKAMLRVGGSSVVLNEFEPATFLQAIDRYSVTYLSGVPTMYRRLLNELETLGDRNVSSVRLATAGSAPVTIDLLEDFMRIFGALIIEGYGLTEGGPIVLATPRW